MRKRFLNPCLLLVVFIFAAATMAIAKDNPASSLSVKAEVDHAFLTIGDPVVYTVTIKRGSDVQILSSIPPPSKDIFSIKKSEDIRSKDGPIIIEGRKFSLTTYRLGEFVLDPISLDYRIGKGPIQKIQTDKIYLTVKSVAEGEDKKDIRGIKPVFTIPFAWRVLWISGFILALILSAWFALQYFRKPKAQDPERDPDISLEDSALNQLTQLLESELLRQGKVKEYYLAFSEILRHYFENRFHILAIESTTDEIIHVLKSKDLDPALRDKIRDVLETADLAKFAKWKPEPAQIQMNYQKAREIIEISRPKADHVPVSAP